MGISYMLNLFLGFLLSILAGYIFYILQKSNKKLSYKLLTNTSLVIIEEKNKEKFKITYNGRVIEDAQVIEIKIINSGRAPINPDDYYKKLFIGFNEEVEILHSEIIDKSSDLLDIISIDTDNKQKIEFEPTLLNKGDWFILKVIVSKFKDKVIVDGRISGVNKIEELKETIAPAWVLISSVIILVTIIILYDTSQNDNVGLVSLGFKILISVILIFQINSTLTKDGKNDIARIALFSGILMILTMLVKLIIMVLEKYHYINI